MYDALVNIFQTIFKNIINPIWNALEDTNIIKPLLSFSNGLINNLTRLWNDNNTFQVTITNELVSYIIGLIVLVIIFEIVYAIFRIVFTAFETIEKNINSFDNKQRWKKRGGHKKKWNY